MSPLRAIWRLLDAGQRRRLVALQLLAVVMALSTLVGVASLLPFLAVVAEPAQLARFPWLEGLRVSLGLDPRSLVIVLGAGFMLAVILASAVNLLGTLAIARFAMDAGDRFHAALLAEYLRRDYAFHLRTGSARMFNRVVFITNRIAHGILESALLLAANLIAALLIMMSIVWVDARVALAALLWLGGGYLLVYGASRRRLLRNGIEESDLIDARARIANDSLGSIRDVKLRALESTYAGRFERVCRSISRITLASQSIALAPRHAMECLTVAGLVAAALFLSRDRSPGAWIAQLSFLGFAAYRLLPAVQQIFVSLVRIRANRALFEEVEPDLASALALPCEVVTPPATMLVPRRDIVLENVSFGFEAGRGVLRDVSAVIPAGAMVGVAGANGSGKSTLLDLLMALHRPDSGRLRVDGVEIAANNRAAWQRAVSFVPQSIYLVNASLGENIAFGEVRADIDARRLHAAALQARLLPLVESLPLGFDEPVGNGGRELSGGERQRVAIARALYRDSAVLLMDEATSALDGLTEQEIVELLRGLRGTRTVVFVAHRLNTLRECDRIFELQAGSLAGAGSFAELMVRSTNFRQMAAGYGVAKH